MDDENMVNVAADIEEVRDVIPAMMPRIHTTWVNGECEGCTLYHPSQTQHRCLDPVDKEKKQDQDRPAFGKMHR